MVDHGHVQCAFTGMGVRVINVMTEDLMVEGVIECWEEFSVESLDDLGFDVGGVDVLEGSVEHFLKDSKVIFVIRVHSFQAHSIDDLEFIVSIGSGKCPFEMAVIIDNQVFLVCKCV